MVMIQKTVHILIPGETGLECGAGWPRIDGQS